MQSIPYLAPKAYSQRFDLSQAVKGDPTLANSPYKVLNANGDKIASGALDSSATTNTIFTAQPEKIATYVGTGQWSIISHVPNHPAELE